MTATKGAPATGITSLTGLTSLHQTERVRAWIDRLRGVNYFIDPQTALTVDIWWQTRPGPLVLEGPPGGGKTRLAEAIAEALSLHSSFYRLQCYASIGKKQALYDWDANLQKIALDRHLQENGGTIPTNPSRIIYDWANMVPGQLVRAMMDPNEHTFTLLDEVDKVPRGEAFEAMLLEYLGENAITIPERNFRLRPRSGLPVHTVITSNAGVDNSSLTDTLSYPLLRRGIYIYVPEPDRMRRYMILRSYAPNLPREVIRDAVIFVERVTKWQLDKAVALSETVMWIKALEYLQVEALTVEVIHATLGMVAKIAGDIDRLADSARQIIEHVKNHRDEIDIERAEAELAAPLK